MNEIITQTLYFIASYVGIIFFIIFASNWLSKGWFLAFVRVKASRGKKTLVICYGITDTYFRIGEFKGSAFHFKDRDGKGKILTKVSRTDIIHFTGVSAIGYDIEKDNIVTMGECKPGTSTEEADNFLNRVMMAPSIEDKIKFAILILLIIALVMLIIDIYFGYSNSKALLNAKLAGVIQ